MPVVQAGTGRVKAAVVGDRPSVHGCGQCLPISGLGDQATPGEFFQDLVHNASAGLGTNDGRSSGCRSDLTWAEGRDMRVISKVVPPRVALRIPARSEEHTSELQSRGHLVCRLLLEKKKYRTPNVVT